MSGTRIGALGLLVAAGVLASAPPTWAQGTFTYRKQLQVNGGAGGLAGGPHLNFPLLVSLPNDANLLAHVAAGGRDIMFEAQNSTMCGGPATCILPHEIERWDGATGTLVAWVRVPSILAGDKVYMYYGNAQITAATETPASVWDSAYVGVWHLDETGGGLPKEYRDSTGFANHGRGGKGVAAATPARVAGKIGFAQNFSNGDGTYDFVDAGSDGTLNISGNQITLEAWVRHNIVVSTAHGTPPNTNVPYGIMAHKGYSNGYSLWLHGEDFTCPGSDTKPCAVFNLPGRSHALRTTMTAGPSAGTWHRVVATYHGAAMNLHQDGALVAGPLAKTGNVSPSGAEPDFWIGHGDQPDNRAWSGQFEDDLDEVRVSRVARSANWILTEYNNQSAPATFYTVGSEETAGGPWALTPITVNYRSIGTAADHTTGTVSATLNSVVVTGSGTAWRTANRGRGDRITVNAVDSETSLRLTSPFTSATGSYPYTIARKFGSPAAWEDCIDGPGGAGCEGVASASLVTDNRSEVGIVCYDGSNPAGSPVLTIDGSTTDAAHAITLTADLGNRHPGRGSAGPTWAAFSNDGTSATIQVYDNYVTVEWLELSQSGASGNANSHGVEINNLSPANHVVVRYSVIHPKGNGIQISDVDTVADIYVAPEAFLPAAQALLERRESQGLRTKAASIEEIASGFGHGEASGEAIRSFLTHAYQEWQRPSPRYVVLLGDASHDPRNFIGTSAPAPLPAMFLKTSYLVTASDPALAAVNGEDLLPDLAIGRLPAQTEEQAQALIQKVLTWEESGQGLRGKAVLVADNPTGRGTLSGTFQTLPRASWEATSCRRSC